MGSNTGFSGYCHPMCHVIAGLLRGGENDVITQKTVLENFWNYIKKRRDIGDLKEAFNVIEKRESTT